MGTQLSQVRQPAILPPRVVIHGGGGAGKTTFGASAPSAILMPLEEGEGILNVQALPKPGCYVDVMNALGELQVEEHPYKTLVLDTIDHLEPLIWQAVCDTDSKKNHIEDFGYGKGYTKADPFWIGFFQALDGLRRKGMTILALCHNEGKIIDDPTAGSYNKWTPKLHKRANALLYEWADVVGFLEVERMVQRGDGDSDKKARSTSTGQRMLYLEDLGGFVAKNRYDLPTRLSIPKEDSYQTLRAEIIKSITNAKQARESAGKAA